MRIDAHRWLYLGLIASLSINLATMILVWLLLRSLHQPIPLWRA